MTEQSWERRGAQHRWAWAAAAVALLLVPSAALTWWAWSAVRAPADEGAPEPAATPAAEGDDVLALPPPGEAIATTLGDGAPVFVVHHEDGGVDVLSAVQERHGRLVAWSAEHRAFVEPTGASVFDERGRYVAGPAPSGLARHAIEPRGDDAVVVAEADAPLPRWERPERDVAVPSGAIGATATNGDGATPGWPALEPADPLPAGELGAEHAGRVVHVSGTVDFDHTPPRLCAIGAAGCEESDPPVADTWFGGEHWYDRGRAEGRWLVRVDDDAAGVSDLADARGPGPEDFAERYERTARSATTPQTRVTARLVEADAEAVVLEDVAFAADQPGAGGGAGSGALEGEGGLRLPLADRPSLALPPGGAERHGMTSPHLSPAELGRLLEAEGPRAAVLTLDGQDRVVAAHLEVAAPTAGPNGR